MDDYENPWTSAMTVYFLKENCILVVPKYIFGILSVCIALINKQSILFVLLCRVDGSSHCPQSGFLCRIPSLLSHVDSGFQYIELWSERFGMRPTISSRRCKPGPSAFQFMDKQ
ncbi:MAG: hypothetical protein WAM14_21235 [Candidatus Nitrosopolaris sp.]